MHRIDTDGNVSGAFTEGDPDIPQEATVVGEDWLNAIQEEICNLLEDYGVTLSKPDNTQLSTLIQALFSSVAHTYTATQTFNNGVTIANGMGISGGITMSGSAALDVSGNLLVGDSDSHIAQRSFTTASLLNSWGTSGSYEVPGYRLTCIETVQLRGAAVAPATPTSTIFTLPTGSRPSAARYVSTIVLDDDTTAFNHCILKIDTTGDVTPLYGSEFSGLASAGNLVFLDGVTFPL